MAIFQIDPEKSSQRDINAAIANRSKLTLRLSDAESAVISATSAVQQLAINGAEDPVLDAAEAKVRALTARVTTLKSAITKNEFDLGALERERAKVADKQLRRETATEIAELAVGLEETAKALDPVLERMAELAGRATKYHIFVEQGLLNFAASSRAQIPDATTLLASVLRVHATAVLTGSKAPPKHFEEEK
jgi:hypothetical protein